MLKRLLNWFHDLNLKTPVKAKVIGGIFLIVATIIGGIFSRIAGKENQAVMHESQMSYSSFVQGAQQVTITNNYLSQDTSVQDVVKEFDKKLSQADTKIDLTRNELTLLSKALKDLDQRTSGIQKLPDGRTKFGEMVSGVPSVIIDEQNASSSSFQNNDFLKSLEHSQVAIKAYESSKNITATIIAGNIEPKEASKIYRLAAMAAQRLSKVDLAYQYAKECFNLNPISANAALLSTTLANQHKPKEALEYIEKALSDEPTNQEFLKIKQAIEQKNQK